MADEIRVKDVKRDEKKQAIWVTMEYWESGVFRGAVAFMRQEGRVRLIQRRPANYFLPDKIFRLMLRQAYGIILPAKRNEQPA